MYWVLMHYFWYSAGSDPYSSGDSGYQRVMMEPIRVGTEDISPVRMGTKHRLVAITVLPNGNLPMPELREVMVQLNPRLTPITPEHHWMDK